MGWGGRDGKRDVEVETGPIPPFFGRGRYGVLKTQGLVELVALGAWGILGSGRM